VYDLDGYLAQIDSAGRSSYTFYDDGRISSRSDDTEHDYSVVAGATNLSVSAASNQLVNTTGTLIRTYSYDTAGNTTNNGSAGFGYNAAGRMNSATLGSVATTFWVNALGQRVGKVTTAATTLFVYDEAGHLIGEYTGSGALVEETVWLGDTPVATLRPRAGSGVDIYYVHTDHLNSPRRLSRASDNVIIWRWNSDPYGNGFVEEDPDGDGQRFTYNLRFPGQYYDAETGLNYNYYRDYDPAVGRYMESDPSGLEGGINTYAYVEGDPISLVDPLGLDGFGPYDPGPPPSDPAPGYRNPSTNKRRDRRTPWLPPNLAERKHCAPYWSIDIFVNGVIPLVREKVLKKTSCELTIECHYHGSIATGMRWAMGAKKVQTQGFDAVVVITTAK
jgi:RHS repeat-associated protein